MPAASIGQRLRVVSRHMTLSLCFGLSLIALVWTVTFTRIRVEGNEAIVAAERTVETLARVLEGNVIRTIADVDKSLQFLALTIQTRGTDTDLRQLVDQTYLYSEAVVNLSVVDESGRTIASSQNLLTDVKEREHFRVHRDGRTDGLFISKPLLGLADGRWSLHFTRAVRKLDGSFGGIVAASIDPQTIARLYRALDVGASGTVALIGADGVVRAGGVRQVVSTALDVSQEAFFGRFQDGVGTVRVAAIDQRQPDRILSFRRVGDYPLYVTVSVLRPSLSLRPSGSLAVHIMGSFALTLVVLTTMAISIRHNQRLEDARLSLVTSEAKLRLRSRELQLTLDSIAQGILMVDAEGDVAVVNERAAELLEIPKELLARPFTYRELVAAFEARGEFADARRASQAVLDYIRGVPGSAVIPVFERERPNGTILETRTTLLPDGGFVRTFTDITERRRSEAQIIHLARHDSLTNLANRTVFREELETAVAKSTSGFAVLGVDLDRFKAVNDTAGHPVGDRLLKMVAKRLLTTIRENDIAARLGGDEFAIIQMDVPEPSVAGALASRICRRLSEPYEIDGKTVVIGASVGIAMADGTSAEALLKAADLALYAAKSEGRGTWRFFDPDMNARLAARRQLEEDLRGALAAEQLDVHFQPKIDISTRRVSGFEALLRWHHPQRGMVPPSEFVAIAEELGLIVEIGAWVLERACRDIARLPGNLGLAVNLSSAQFRTGNLVTTVERALEQSGLEPSRLELEITETLLLERDSQTLDQLYALRRLGVRVSMDDFGTGYSSLSYLLSFPFDRIKIDRSFVRQLAHGGPSVAIVRAIVGLARSLGIATTAEGVESLEELETLQGLGCSEAQGYAFGKPMPAAAAFAVLANDAAPSATGEAARAA